MTTLNPLNFITLARNELLEHFQCLSPSPGSGLAIGKEFRSIGLQGAELWPFKEGKGKGCLKIKATGCITDTRPYGSLNSAM